MSEKEDFTWECKECIFYDYTPASLLEGEGFCRRNIGESG